MPISGIIIERKERDFDNLLRVGLRAGNRVAGKLRARIMEELRSGYKIQIKEYLQQQLQPILGMTMLAGHLSGYRRAWLTLKQAPGLMRKVKERLEAEQALSLGALDDAIKVLRNRAGIDIDKLQKQYDTTAIKVLNRVSETTENELRKTIADLIESGSHNKQAIETLGKKFVELGLSPAKNFQLETIFRTQSGLAYGAGKWQAEQDPDIQEILWGYKYVTVGDERVRDEHAILEGVTLPKNDPFWDRFTPPNGWNCRCYAIPIFEEREHVPPPVVDDNGEPPAPDKGFDFNPGKIFDASAPRLDKMPETPEQTATLKTPPVKVDLDATDGEAYTTDWSNSESARIYKTHSTGVANAERFDPKAIERVAEVQKRLSEQHNALEAKRLRVLELSGAYARADAEGASLVSEYNLIMNSKGGISTEQYNRAKEIEQELKEVNEQRAALREKAHNALAVNNPVEVAIIFPKGTKPEQIAEYDKAQEFLGKVLDTKFSQAAVYGKPADGEYQIKAHKDTTGRASFVSSTESSAPGIYVNDRTKAGTIVHEVGHSLEESKTVDELSRGFLYHRIGDEKFGWIGDKAKDADHYKAGEICAKDDFVKMFGNKVDADMRGAYTGKWYGDNTEILSMGIEQLYNDPIGFAARDPEFFRFITGITSGKLL